LPGPLHAALGTFKRESALYEPSNPYLDLFGEVLQMLFYISWALLVLAAAASILRNAKKALTLPTFFHALLRFSVPYQLVMLVLAVALLVLLFLGVQKFERLFVVAYISICYICPASYGAYLARRLLRNCDKEQSLLEIEV
jgi:hypothetical protein